MHLEDGALAVRSLLDADLWAGAGFGNESRATTENTILPANCRNADGP